MSGNKPVKRFKAGAINASVFENTNMVKGVETKIFNVVVSKTYKDKEDNWKSSHSFSVFYEIPKVILVLQKAYEFVIMNAEKKENEEGGDI